MGQSFCHRESCRLCDSKNVERVVPLEPVPLPDRFLTKDEIGKVKEEYFPMDLYMCRDCGHVQLLDLINPDLLWDENFSFHSGQAKVVVDHFEAVSANIVKKYGLKAPRLIIDVGSNDGTMLKFFKNQGFKVLGIDPAKAIAAKAIAAGIPTVAKLLNPAVAKEIRESHGPAAVVMAFNVFAHSDKMGEMADSIRALLDADGIFVFEVQYLLDIIDQMLLGTIIHEHMSHHSVKPMQQFLKKHGMELIAVERNPMQGGSIIGVAQLVGAARPVESSVKELLALEKQRGLDKPETIKIFGTHLNQMKQQIQELVAKWKAQGATIAGYGAARSGPTLIAQFWLGDVIRYMVDDHPQKVNKLSPGHHIPVVPTKELCNRMPDYTVILAVVHAKRIIETNQAYLEKGGHFLVCLPDVKVIGAKQAAVL